MKVSVATLRAVSPSAFTGAAADLKSAAARLRRDCVTFQTKVQHPLDAGHGWRGGGQPDAKVVVRVNALAYGTSSMRMQAAGNVLGALGHAMTKAKRRLTDVEQEATDADLTVSGDDKVVVAHQSWGFDRHSPSPSWSKSDEIDALQRELDGVLLFATAADTLARRQLARYTRPLVTTQTADRSQLQRALTDNAEAASDLLGSRALAEQLSKARPRPLPPDQTLDQLLEYAHAYAPVAQDAIIIFLGAVLEAEGLIGVALGTAGGIALSETGVGILAGAGVVAVEGAVAYTGHRLMTWGTERLDKDLALAKAKTSGQSSGRHQPQSGEVVCDDGKVRIYEPNPKHGRQQRGNISAEPTDGKEALKHSVPVKQTSDARVAIDKESGEYIVFRKHHDQFRGDDEVPAYHGYSLTWKELDQDLKNAMQRAGLTNSNGKILGR